jgi:LPPG:FO 2-phospho-L-lactate transferase
MRVVELSGGVGGARLARGLAALDDVELTVVVNVGDDAENHGFHISPDVDTVIYTLAGVEGPQGWGRAGDTFNFNTELARFGVDNTFRLGDLDLALKVFRTVEMAKGTPLSKVTSAAADGFGVSAAVLPATDDRLRTEVRLDDGWIGFQEYFVARGHRDVVHEVRFIGADRAVPAPGVVEAIATADLVVIGPSNPPLSVWPILAVPGLRPAVDEHPAVVAVSPLIGGKTVKGPADRVMSSLGLGTGNHAVVDSYRGLIDRLVIDNTDSADAASLRDVEVVVTDTLITDPKQATRLARELVEG